jgi:PST family polysaccharide transporter
VKLVLTVISGPILSRLIGPAPYGVLAPAQSVSALGNLVSESGFAYHTVTAGELAPSQARHIQQQSIRLSIAVGLAAALIASTFSASSVGERLVRAGLCLAMVCIAGLTAVPFAWAQRQGHFARLQWWGVATQALTTFAVAIPMALLHLGIWAAGTNLVLPAALSALIAWRIAAIAHVSPTVANIPRSFRFGSLTSNVGSYLAGNVDVLTLSTYFSISALGVYSRANLLASLPGTVVAAAISRVGLASLSRSQRWSDHFSFLWKATALSVLAFSAQATLAACGVDLMGLAFGPKFATPPAGFALLTTAQVFFYACSLLNTYLIVRKRPLVVGVTQTIHAVVTGSAFLLFRPTNIAGVAVVLLIPSAINYFGVAAYIFATRRQGQTHQSDRQTNRVASRLGSPSPTALEVPACQEGTT